MCDQYDCVSVTMYVTWQNSNINSVHLYLPPANTKSNIHIFSESELGRLLLKEIKAREIQPLLLDFT